MIKTISLITAASIILAAVFLFLNIKDKPELSPSMNFNIIDGRVITLEELKGKTVLVTFWASTCATCIKEMPQLMALYDELNARGLEIIGIAMPYDPPNKVLETVKAKQVTYPIALDIDGQLMKSFGDVEVTPTVFLISPEGVLLDELRGELPIDKLKQTILSLLSNKQQDIG